MMIEDMRGRHKLSQKHQSHGDRPGAHTPQQLTGFHKQEVLKLTGVNALLEM